ncbi:MAG TPA: nitroreductase family protein [Acidobacteriota bacterium]|nr:nitroreductase family protein [Acidobacteriota bacterium]
MHLKPLHRVLVERRAPRHFSDPPPPDGVLQMILHAGLQAHSAYRVQPARFVVVRDSRKRARLRRAAFNEPCVAEAPVIIVAFGRRDQWRDALGEAFPSDLPGERLGTNRLDTVRPRANDTIERTPIRVWLHRHVMMAFTCMMLTAEALGWDTTLVERFDADAVASTLSLPTDAEVVALLAIGRAASVDLPEHDSSSLAHLVYSERYGEPWQG